MLFDTEKMNQDYESIRPYNDEETSAALKRVADSVELASISAFLYGPDKEKEEALRAVLRRIDTVDQFQAAVMAGAIQAILDRTSSTYCCPITGTSYWIRPYCS